jgi:hypothetical protein
VASAAHRQQKIVRASEADGADDIGNATAARNQRGPFVDHAVPDLARVVIARLRVAEQRAAKAGLEVLDGGFLENCGREGGAPSRGHLLVRHDTPPFCSETISP